MATPIYCGRGRKHGKFKDCISMGFSEEDIKILQANVNERGYANVLISPTRENRDKYYAKIDDYQPRSEQRQEERAEQERQGFQPNDKIEPEKSDDLPF
jgi:hypothetical protein